MTTTRKRKTKRKTKNERQLEEARRLAAVIVSEPIEAGGFAVPGLIRDPRSAPALAMWREVVPLLQSRRILDDTDRFQLAMLCYWWQEFVLAADDIVRRGYSVMVKTISGDRMPRLNPSVARRGRAFDEIADLSTKFGLTPIDRYALHRAAKGRFLSSQLPLDGAADEQAAGKDEVARWDDEIGLKH